MIDVVNSAASNGKVKAKEAAPEASTTARRITLADFKPVQRVGQGDVGSVHLVKLKKRNNTKQETNSKTKETNANKLKDDDGDGEEKPLKFAMKVLTKQEMIERNKLHRLRTESTILQMCDHPYLATMFTAFHSETHVYFLMDFYNNWCDRNYINGVWRYQ